MGPSIRWRGIGHLYSHLATRRGAAANGQGDRIVAERVKTRNLA